MNWLDFARGPALDWALGIFLFGVLWRLGGVLLLARARPLSPAKPAGGSGLGTVIGRFWPKAQFASQTRFSTLVGWLLHLGLFVVILLFVPHIAFIKGLTGLSWPGLPNNVVMLASVITLGALVAFLVRRLTHPVLRLISGADDYLSWLLTALPVLTGIMAFLHLGPKYETMLALHILSVELLLIWFPFGKLMHAVLFIPSRAQTGAFFARRGVKA
jgi:nitrate reductase gamma subunit